MEKCRISILIPDDNSTWGNNDFVRGKIVAYAECICKKCTEGRTRIAMRPMGGIGKMITVEGTIEEYVELKTLINEHYPELCKFGIVMIEK